MSGRCLEKINNDIQNCVTKFSQSVFIDVHVYRSGHIWKVIEQLSASVYF